MKCSCGKHERYTDAEQDAVIGSHLDALVEAFDDAQNWIMGADHKSPDDLQRAIDTMGSENVSMVVTRVLEASSSVLPCEIQRVIEAVRYAPR